MRVIEILATQPTLNERIGLVNGISFIRFDREKLQSSKEHLDDKTGIYILFGMDTHYIGESDDLYKRLVDHDRQKDFWDYAICFASDTFSKSSIVFLERTLIDKFKELELPLENKTIGFNHKISFMEKAKCTNSLTDIFDIINMLKIQKPYIK